MRPPSLVTDPVRWASGHLQDPGVEPRVRRWQCGLLWEAASCQPKRKSRVEVIAKTCARHRRTDNLVILTLLSMNMEPLSIYIVLRFLSAVVFFSSYTADIFFLLNVYSSFSFWGSANVNGVFNFKFCLSTGSIWERD